MKLLLSKVVTLLCAASALASPRRGPTYGSSNLPVARQTQNTGTQNNGLQDIVSDKLRYKGAYASIISAFR